LELSACSAIQEYMCGRFTLTVPERFFSRSFAFKNLPVMKPSFNVAPGTDILTVKTNAKDDDVSMERMHWGFVPEWASDPSIGYRMINARSETVTQKPAFRAAFQSRRCLIPADGFYEWQGKGKHKQAFFIRLKSQEPFAFAGLWEHWQQEDRAFNSCTILTTRANGLMTPIHHRMPVILAPQHYQAWLNPKTAPDKLISLLEPFPEEPMESRKVSSFVNSPKNNSAQCLEKQESGPIQESLFD